MSHSDKHRAVNNDLTRWIDKMHDAILDTEASSRPVGNLFQVWWGLKERLEHIAVAQSASERIFYANPEQVPQRGDAVNLASNIREHYGIEGRGLHLTPKGIRELADAVLLMDAWIREVTKAAPSHGGQSQHTSGRTALPFDQCDSFSTPSAPSQPAEGPTPETDALDAKDYMCHPDDYARLVEMRAHARSLERQRDEARRELAAARSASEDSQWIPVSERRPPSNTAIKVLAVSITGAMRVEHAVEVVGLWDDAQRNQEDCYLTHWRPLPSAPLERGAKP